MLTVTLPVYNAMPFLKDAVDSILEQSYKDFKFIIIDDGSTDNSFAYLKTIRDQRITLLSQSNQGLGATLNKMIMMAKTEYIARMDADDICHPERLEKQIEFLEKHNDVILVGTGIYFIDNEGNSQKSSPILTHHNDIISRFYKKKFGVCHASIAFRKSAFIKAGGYRVQGQGEDLDFLLRMAEVGKLSNLNEYLYSYRQHENTITTNSRDKMHLGYSYAIECAKNRLSSKPEPTFEDYCRKWTERSLLSKTDEWLNNVSEKFYRIAILKKMKHEKSAYLYLFIAALLRPHTVLERIVLRLRIIYRNMLQKKEKYKRFSE